MSFNLLQLEHLLDSRILVACFASQYLQVIQDLQLAATVCVAAEDSEGKVRNVEAYGDRTAVEWETTPAESAETTVFTWIGGAQVRPVRPAFPMPMATLSVDGTPRLRFPLGQTARSYVTNDEGFSLTIEPRRFQSLVEPPHRSWSPDGVSGFYRPQLHTAHHIRTQYREPVAPIHAGNGRALSILTGRAGGLRSEQLRLVVRVKS